MPVIRADPQSFDSVSDSFKCCLVAVQEVEAAGKKDREQAEVTE